jgi:TRAP-type mannitol/chloroaromatic compound transport system permease small subunit
MTPFLRKLYRGCDTVNAAVGGTVAWFAIGMVLVQFAVVMLRYVFGVGFIFMQESMNYLHGFMFLLGAGYTLLVNGHVRVDIFYREATVRTKAWVDLFGSLILLLPMCVLVIWASWGPVMQSWRTLETSAETSGIPAVFLLRTAIPAFALLMIVQGISVAAKSLLALAGFESEAHGAERPAAVAVDSEPDELRL